MLSERKTAQVPTPDGQGTASATNYQSKSRSAPRVWYFAELVSSLPGSVEVSRWDHVDILQPPSTYLKQILWPALELAYLITICWKTAKL